jgi:hypothetical protein
MHTTMDITHAGVTLRYENDGLVCETAADVPATLSKHGVALLPSVIGVAEQAAMNRGMWDTLEHLTSGLLTPVQHADPSTYHSAFELAPNHGGLFQHHSWGHAQYAWDVRQNPKVAAPFAAVYGSAANDMLVSFDGINCSLGGITPGERRGVYRGGNWLHIDQRLSEPRFQCVQAWVTANAVEPGDATLRVLRGSHAHFGDMAEHFGLTETKVDWCKVTAEQQTWLKERGCVEICVTCPAGSMVLWDSRTVHSGTEPVPAASCPPRKAPRTARNVVYVCMQPRDTNAKALARNLAKRRKIFDPDSPDFLRLASHWPNKMKLFGRYPRSYGNEPPAGCRQSDPSQHWSFVPTMPAPALTAHGRRIAGLE